MGSLNKVILIGNLGKDPETKVTQNGKSVARFSIATTETWKTQEGEKQQKTEWHQIVAWNKLAEIVGKYLRKGKQVMIEGRIQYREYTDNDNVKRNFTEIQCDNLVMLGRAEDGNNYGYGEDTYKGKSGGGTATAPQNSPQSAPQSNADYDDDIPF